MPSGFDLPLDASLLGLLPYLFPFFHFFSLFMDSIVCLPSRRASRASVCTHRLFRSLALAFKTGEETALPELVHHADKTFRNSPEKSRLMFGRSCLTRVINSDIWRLCIATGDNAFQSRLSIMVAMCFLPEFANIPNFFWD